MTPISLNIAGKVDRETIAVFEAVNAVTAEANVPYVVVGATARDLVLQLGYSTQAPRATYDLDFGIEVPSWDAFEALKNGLIERGFTAARTPHRLRAPTDTTVDIVPFGAVAEAEGTLRWPPTGDVTMNVLGFRDACDAAQRVRVSDTPELDIPVATPSGMVILKLVAWLERMLPARRKDASDLAFLLRSYERVPSVRDLLYDTHFAVLEHFGWDLEPAGACLLGRHAIAIARADTQAAIIQGFLATDGVTSNYEDLTYEMSDRGGDQYNRARRLLDAFFEGFQ